MAAITAMFANRISIRGLSLATTPTLIIESKSTPNSVVIIYFPLAIPLRQMAAASSGEILVDYPSISHVTFGFNLFSSINPGVSIVEGVNK